MNIEVGGTLLAKVGMSAKGFARAGRAIDNRLTLSLDRPNFSFGPYITEPGGETQVHQWIGPILTKFRELELQLLAGRLATFLGGTNSFIGQTSA